MISKYIPLQEYAKQLNIKDGDIIFISSDTKIMLWDAIKNKANPDLNIFIDGLIDAVGKNGTVIFPTYNWSFCNGETFDYANTPCKTGTLGTLALKRDDFKRTKHPIYSFAVFGKYQQELCSLNNKDSFGLDSPFAFFKRMGVKNYIIDVSLKNCFTFTHFAEQQSNYVKHRYIKNFTAEYIDGNGRKTTQTYSMFVRNLDLNVETLIDPIEPNFIEKGAEKLYNINNSTVKLIYMDSAYDILIEDIIKNSSKKLCSFKGQ